MTPLVSILTTAYNREKFIAQCIESILASTFQDYELIVVDDCSGDETYSIAKQYATKDKRIKVYKNEKNLGQFANRNYAASLAKGKYLKFLDSDDTIYPYGLEAMISIMEKFPDAGFAISHDRQHEDAPYPIVLTPYKSYHSFFISGGFPNSGPSAAILLKTAFENIGGFESTGYVGNDTVLWLKMAAQYNVVKMPPGLIWYRQHTGQALVQGIQSNEYLTNKLKVLSELLTSNKCPLSDTEKHLALKKLKHRHSRDIISLAVKQRRPIAARKVFKESKLSFLNLIKALFPVSK